MLPRLNPGGCDTHVAFYGFAMLQTGMRVQFGVDVLLYWIMPNELQHCCTPCQHPFPLRVYFFALKLIGMLLHHYTHYARHIAPACSSRRLVGCLPQLPALSDMGCSSPPLEQQGNKKRRRLDIVASANVSTSVAKAKPSQQPAAAGAAAADKGDVWLIVG